VCVQERERVEDDEEEDEISLDGLPCSLLTLRCGVVVVVVPICYRVRHVFQGFA
jgi:hypothetical protein